MEKRLCLFFACLAFMMPVWAGARVDLNTATQAQLESVKGIGPAKARAIVDYRQEMGRFRNVDDLKKVTGFGPKTFEKIRSELTVSNTPPFAVQTETRKNR